ncbi:uncharacterized protein LOC123548026 [Mercenaria mercenaria]|uniref:uncharacterized protein LOC123548026 n=1 Tax=Mercenaria mercenaria TaxID=6596 RepID=UPI00234F3C02|nr:uncharacterized protein LOC123548026 [Mercenaria mercenaria]
MVIGQMVSKRVISRAVTRHCEEMTLEEKAGLKRNLARTYQGLHWTFWKLPPFQKGVRELFPQDDALVTNTATESQISEAPKGTCPAEIKPGVKLCPVRYVQQTDKSRIPENIVQARCNCEHCFHVNSSLLVGKCEEVQVLTPVLRRTVGECKYKQDIEHVTIACTCRMQQLEIVNV